MTDILTQLEDVLNQRKQADPESSYTAKLYSDGINKILEKIGEESTETIIAAKDYANATSAQNKKALVSETADLWFHTLIMLTQLNTSHQEVLDELGKRFGISGLDEKASRNQSIK